MPYNTPTPTPPPSQGGRVLPLLLLGAFVESSPEEWVGGAGSRRPGRRRSGGCRRLAPTGARGGERRRGGDGGGRIGGRLWAVVRLRRGCWASSLRTCGTTTSPPPMLSPMMMSLMRRSRCRLYHYPIADLSPADPLDAGHQHQPRHHRCGKRLHHHCGDYLIDTGRGRSACRRTCERRGSAPAIPSPQPD